MVGFTIEQKRAAYIFIALIFIGFVILGILVRFYPIVPNEPTLPPLDPLPPADETPGEEIVPFKVDNITFSVQSKFFMILPHRAPNHFSFDLVINVTNEGSSSLSNFDAVKATVFFQNNSLLYTFGLTPLENYSIATGEERVLNYENDRNMPEVLSKLQFEFLYLRVLVMYNSSEEVIITTPLTSILVAVE
jgi:hypothetical protein